MMRVGGWSASHGPRSFVGSRNVFLSSSATAGDTWGYEAYYHPLERMARNLGLEEVVFTGQVEDEELSSYYDAAHVYLSLSEHEGFCVLNLALRPWWEMVASREA